MAIKDKSITPTYRKDTESTPTGGSAYGYIKCTYVQVYANDKMLFSFDKIYLNGSPVVYVPALSVDTVQEAYLTPYARQAFVDMLKNFGWVVNSNNELEEIPVYDKRQVYKGTHAGIGEDGRIVYIKDYIEQYVVRKYTDARHTKIYQQAVQLLPYILDPELPVYVRNNTLRWDLEDTTPTEPEEEDVIVPEVEDEETEITTQEKTINSRKMLGLLTLLATLLTMK